MLFNEPFLALTKETEKIWAQLSKYDGQTLNLAQAPGKWSILQHIVHLNKSERSFVVLLTRGLKSNAPLNGSKLKIFFRSRWFKWELSRGRRIKAPKVIEPAQEVFSLEEVKNDFAKTRAQLYQLLETITPEQADKFWVHHMYLKELRVNDLLGFMKYHQYHHQKLFSRYLK